MNAREFGKTTVEKQLQIVKESVKSVTINLDSEYGESIFYDDYNPTSPDIVQEYCAKIIELVEKNILSIIPIDSSNLYFEYGYADEDKIVEIETGKTNLLYHDILISKIKQQIKNALDIDANDYYSVCNELPSVQAVINSINESVEWYECDQKHPYSRVNLRGQSYLVKSNDNEKLFVYDTTYFKGDGLPEEVATCETVQEAAQFILQTIAG